MSLGEHHNIGPSPAIVISDLVLGPLLANGMGLEALPAVPVAINETAKPWRKGLVVFDLLILICLMPA